MTVAASKPPDSSAWPTTSVMLLSSLEEISSEAAWAYFVARYRRGILRICRRELQLREELAEEATQEVLMKLLGAMHEFRYDPQGSFRSWLATVAKRAAIDVMRRESRRRDLAVGGDDAAELMAELPETAAKFCEQLQDELRRDLLHEVEPRVRIRLSESTTWAVYQAYRRGEAPEAIAARLGMTRAAVYKAKSRVVQLVRREISELTHVF